MKILDVQNDFNKLSEYFDKLDQNQYSVVLWQFDPSQNCRVFYRTNLDQLEKEDKKLLLRDQTDREFDFKENEVFGYIEAFQSIFKTSILDQSSDKILIAFPEKLHFLEAKQRETIQNVFSEIDSALVDGSVEPLYQSDEDIFQSELDQFLSPDEEDKLFADKRIAPRARPKKTKMVTISRIQDDKMKIYELYDLSQGGMAFLSLEENYFQVSDEIHVHAFDQKSFEVPMIAQVMSTRPADELGVQFKIGLKFIG